MPVAGTGTIQFAVVNISTATTTTIVSAVTGKSIAVLSYCLSVTGTTPTFKFQSSTGTVAMSGVFDSAGVYSMNGANRDPLMETIAGDSLQIVTTGTPSVRGHISYYTK